MSTICRRPTTVPPVNENSFTTLFTGIFAAVATPPATGHPGTTGPVNGQIGRPSIAAIPFPTLPIGATVVVTKYRPVTGVAPNSAHNATVQGCPAV